MTLVEHHILFVEIACSVTHSEHQRIFKKINNIQDIHASRYGVRSFLLAGQVIWNNDAQAAKAPSKKPLDSDLVPEATSLIKREKKLLIDRKRMVNFLSTTSTVCESYQDYRDLLPELVVEKLHDHNITLLPRTRESGYPYLSDELKMKQFKYFVDMMFHYLGKDLVFQ